MSESNFEIFESAVKKVAEENHIEKYNLEVQREAFTGNNFLSHIIRVKIIEDGSQKRQINLLVKLNNISEEGRIALPAETFFKREVNAYNVVIPELSGYQNEYSLPAELRFKHAKYYEGSLEYLKEYLILEDLSCLDYHLYGKEKPLDYEHSKSVLQTLANFHAISFAMRAKDPKRFSKLTENISKQQNYPPSITSMGTNLCHMLIQHLQSEKRKDIVRALVENKDELLFQALNSELTEPYNVICHGDLWNNNMLFKRKDDKLDVIFVDFQFMRYASPATDIAYNFQLSTLKAFREANFTKLCDEYYEALRKNLGCYGCDVGVIYPRNIFNDHLIKAMPYGVLFGLMSCGLLMNKQGEEITLEQIATSKQPDVKVTATDKMFERLNGVIDEIIKYNIIE